MTDEQNVQDDMTEENQEFLREIEEHRLDDSRPIIQSPEAIGRGAGRQPDVKRQLLSHVIMRLNDVAQSTASDALHDLLVDAHEGMAEELLEPIFEWSDFWAQRIAAETLELPTDDEYTCEELLRRFEQRERDEAVAQKNTVNWQEEGF